MLAPELRGSRHFSCKIAVSLALLVLPGLLMARDLSFEERVRAQEAIEKVYYSHQIGATRSFAEAVPRDVLERKVRTYLKQSLALERFWNTPVTSAALQQELERIASRTRLPDRLLEVYAALDRDPFLIQECFARPALVDRLAHSLFTADQRFQGDGPEDDWSHWWARTQGSLDDHDVPSVARELSVLPIPGRASRLAIPEGSRPGSDATSASAPPPPACPQDVWDNGTLDDPGGLHPPVGPAVWTGSLLVMWTATQQGGTGDPGVGGRYDPLTDSWSGMTTVLAPTGRVRHTMVWTGNNAVVWGGYASPNYLNDGSHYDPIADTWTPLNVVSGAINLRAGHTAVWTGSRMLVWGGSFQSMLNSGGSYNPATGTWTALSLTNAPAPRSTHSAFWTGSRMIIYGGRDSATFLDSGGIYNPTDDSWTPTSLAGSPGPRFNYSSVWTGSRMMIWGGHIVGFPNTLLDTGALYDPTTDSWTPTRLQGAPAPRGSHSAVWTGRHVIIWGGSEDPTGGGAALTNSGAAYDPATDRWSSTSTHFAPPAMSGHAAVWADEWMLVWGGPSAGGGRYIVDRDLDVDQDLYSLCDGDCDDANPAVHPEAVELCNDVDDDCDGQVDNGFDLDGDGFTTCEGDCQDSNPAVNPGKAELCNGLDENCNDAIDEVFPDADADGYAYCRECNDTNSAVHPGAAEICNGIDDNCDLQADEGFVDQDSDGSAVCVDCNDADANVHPGATEICNSLDDDCDTIIDDGFPDADADGYAYCRECNDANSAVHPGAAEICNGIDDNCDSQADEGFVDQDSDGSAACVDCNDADANVSPGATEVCNFLDDNCNLIIDEGFDLDADGVSVCLGDCNDFNPTVWHHPLEVLDLVVTLSAPLTWSWIDQAPAVGPGVSYQVPSGGWSPGAGIAFQGAACLGWIAGTQIADSRPDPPIDNGYWYLVRARNACGDGTYGMSSLGSERVILACP